LLEGRAGFPRSALDIAEQLESLQFRAICSLVHIFHLRRAHRPTPSIPVSDRERGHCMSLPVISGELPSTNSEPLDLIARAATGDDVAWVELFDTHYPKLYRFFRSRVATHQRAEDLASDVFLEAFRSIGNFQWQGAPFEAWLYGIARRVLASYYRGRKPLEMQPTEHVRDEYLAVEIRDILDRIHPDYRMALELRFVVGLSGAEAAAVMGRGHGAFRSLLLRAVRAFRSESSRDSDEETIRALGGSAGSNGGGRSR
jgi:RNA polymerase sigma factor (sigma-70 family)